MSKVFTCALSVGIRAHNAFEVVNEYHSFHLIIMQKKSYSRLHTFIVLSTTKECFWLLRVP